MRLSEALRARPAGFRIDCPGESSGRPDRSRARRSRLAKAPSGQGGEPLAERKPPRTAVAAHVDQTDACDEASLDPAGTDLGRLASSATAIAEHKCAQVLAKRDVVWVPVAFHQLAKFRRCVE
jgi:hypothetical protein